MTQKELVEKIDLDQRTYEHINFGVYDHNTEKELNRRATLELLMKRIREYRKDLLTLMSKELNNT